ncbi:uncharacterized protein LOC128730172 [Anopheles nili]|uniref:uncharacterized protein LOC128730172 n=1 Tax=Anopheles nili TaxID=185578 RepID=UPI00237AD411|nr:uncharacterized protein LOC128730172 [Anopheles nili]
MRTSIGCHVLLVLSLLALSGSHATIDNATGSVRDNSLPLSEIPPVVVIANDVNQSNSVAPAATSLSPISIASGATTTMVGAVSTTTTSSTVPSSSISTGNEVATTSTSSVEVSSIEPIHQQLEPTSDEFPTNCSEFSASPVQLKYSEKARIHKCCPPGQMIRPRNDFQFECVPGNRELQIETIEAHFYGNNECIEVGDDLITLPVESHDMCKGVEDALMYSADQGDELFVLQNGSLLVLELGSLVSVFDSYCVEMTNDTQLLAKVCEHVQQHLVATKPLILLGVVLSAMALLLTALCYSFVPKLNDMFGYLIAAHTGTFAIGTIFLGLARCGDRCIAPSSVGITEVFSNALLGSSIFVFFLMNVYNAVYVAYYIPNGLEYDNKNKRDMYAFLAVMYSITLIPLFLFPKGGLISIVFVYFGAIVIVQGLSWYYERRLASGIYLHISASSSDQTKINQARLHDIIKQRFDCLLETVFACVMWILFTVLVLQLNTVDIARILAVYCIVAHGLFISVVFVKGQNLWIIMRECWNNSGSVDLRAVENGIEMKPFQRPAKTSPGKDEDALGT